MDPMPSPVITAINGSSRITNKSIAITTAKLEISFIKGSNDPVITTLTSDKTVFPISELC